MKRLTKTPHGEKKTSIKKENKMKEEKIKVLQEAVMAIANYASDYQIIEHLENAIDENEMRILTMDDGAEIHLYINTHDLFTQQYSFFGVLVTKIYRDFFDESINIDVYIPEKRDGDLTMITYDMREWSIEEMLKDIDNKLERLINNDAPKENPEK